MNHEALLALLQRVCDGAVAPAEAVERLRSLPYEEVGPDGQGFARIDHHRSLRTGLPEVIFAAGKSPAQVAEIFFRMARAGGDVLATRADEAAAEAILRACPEARHHAVARIVALRRSGFEASMGRVAVLCAGTSDLPVAEEAAVTAETMGAEVDRVFDVGVAGLHRLLAQRDVVVHADAIVVCAGMEGALPSVVGGLVSVPVIAVPTSVGYGAAFGGLAALLGMLNSCAPNVSVVNIDNGFGAAYIASMIARNLARARASSTAAPAAPVSSTNRAE